MKRFEVKVARKGKKKNFKTYRPVAENAVDAYEWGVRQAREFYGDEGVSEVMGEVTEE
jgi:hypothetical protein